MSNTTTASAKIGKPPNNQRDYNIILGIYRQYGIAGLDPSLGYVFAAKEPENAVHESKQGAIIAGMVVVMLAIIVPTAARLWVRGRGAYTKFGWDDWVLCAGAVRRGSNSPPEDLPRLLFVFISKACSVFIWWWKD